MLVELYCIIVAIRLNCCQGPLVICFIGVAEKTSPGLLCSVSVERDNDEDPIWRIPRKAGLARLQQDGEGGNSPIFKGAGGKEVMVPSRAQENQEWLRQRKNQPQR
jgi:hypothetical protein